MLDIAWSICMIFWNKQANQCETIGYFFPLEMTHGLWQKSTINGAWNGNRSIYPLVNKHRPWQIGVGRLVSIKNWLFSGSIWVYVYLPEGKCSMLSVVYGGDFTTPSVHKKTGHLGQGAVAHVNGVVDDISRRPSTVFTWNHGWWDNMGGSWGEILYKWGICDMYI